MDNNLETFDKVKVLMIVILLFAGLGFIDASYLAIVKFIGSAPVCGELGNCDIVTSSKYSSIGPIPVALMGAIYYLGIILLSVLALDRKSVIVSRLAGKLSWIGLLASVYFVYLQLFVLKSICIYCMISAAGSTIIFILGMLVLRKTKNLPN